MTHMKNRSIIRGILLVAIGVLLLALQIVESAREAVVFFLIGGTLLAIYFYRNNRAYSAAGCVLLGLGLGKLGQSIFPQSGDFISIGLGLGFLSFALIVYLYEEKKESWPLIPGGILFGTGILTALPGFIRGLSLAWPLLLVVAGIAFLVLEARKDRAAQ